MEVYSSFKADLSLTPKYFRRIMLSSSPATPASSSLYVILQEHELLNSLNRSLEPSLYLSRRFFFCFFGRKLSLSSPPVCRTAVLWIATANLNLGPFWNWNLNSFESEIRVFSLVPDPIGTWGWRVKSYKYWNIFWHVAASSQWPFTERIADLYGISNLESSRVDVDSKERNQ